jgi:hypothetical protein
MNDDILNNRVEILRWATRSEKYINSQKRKDNTSGVTGLTWDKQRNKRQAYIYIDGEKLHLWSAH